MINAYYVDTNFPGDNTARGLQLAGVFFVCLFVFEKAGVSTAESMMSFLRTIRTLSSVFWWPLCPGHNSYFSPALFLYAWAPELQFPLTLVSNQHLSALTQTTFLFSGPLESGSKLSVASLFLLFQRQTRSLKFSNFGFHLLLSL